MKTTTRRAIHRWIHILCGLPLIGLVYGPPDEVRPYIHLFQFGFMPLLLLSGLILWKGHLLGRLFPAKDR